VKTGSFCTGIASPELAFRELGWEPQWFSEIDPFACAVLRHRYPSVPNLGDMTQIRSEDLATVDLLVAGTPCQSFSVAGLRKGLADPRGNLALVFLKHLDVVRPRWVVWENVPGVLSSWSDAEEGEDGSRWQNNDFDTFLCGLRELGYGVAWRIFDAQYFGVPQRRRRVFVVGYLGDWRPAAAVLFERDGLSGNPPPCREAGARVAGSLAARAGGGGGLGTDFDTDGGCVPQTVGCLSDGAHMGGGRNGQDADAGMLVTHSLRADGFDASEDGTGRGTPLVPVPILEAGKRCGTRNSARDGVGVGRVGDPMFTLQSGAQHAVAFDWQSGGDSRGLDPKHTAQLQRGQVPAVASQTRFARNGRGAPEGVCPTLQGAGAGATSDMRPCVGSGMAVRRLTPRECERLQGFPDGWTFVPYRGKPAADGPRYRAIGNSMAVPVLTWIGERIVKVEAAFAARREEKP
jgi:DNA (cytosine-5)-methyltransferase 1